MSLIFFPGKKTQEILSNLLKSCDRIVHSTPKRKYTLLDLSNTQKVALPFNHMTHGVTPVKPGPKCNFGNCIFIGRSLQSVYFFAELSVCLPLKEYGTKMTSLFYLPHQHLRSPPCLCLCVCMVLWGLHCNSRFTSCPKKAY